MIKALMNHLDYGFFSELALVIFLGVFLAVTIRTLLMSRRESDSHASIVLSEHPQPGNHQDS